ncbi:glucosidase 2 subunit beta [Sitophilus oryzae]|uniref:Glucosidase 2 subunit beta n=1 Tax=Sitophilus oryzae TaxID=7048 RepID=A0A6J2XX73_SITOR|nr:glucosidase 2 subunit beta [Sitophilus oryzae]
MTKLLYRFIRRKISFFVVPCLIISALFIIYQLKIFYEISASVPNRNSKELYKEKLVRGSHVQEKRFYTAENGKFTCIRSSEVIDFEKVNDDYCDCEDSSDEPGTNACPDGIFYCTQTSLNKKFPKMIPSSKVNDGICDCCDGSEEYRSNEIIKNFPRNLQKVSNHFLVPCPNVC